MGELEELQVKRNHLEKVIYTLNCNYKMFPWNAADKEQNSMIMSALKGQLSLVQDDINQELN